MSWRDFLPAERRTVKFVEDKKKAWGASLNLIGDWSVTGVEKVGQFVDNGIGEGWVILEVNGVAVSESTKLQLRQFLLKRPQVSLTFKAVIIDFTFTY